MSLSWNEIKSRAVSFSKEWEDETNETAEAQTFWNQFFEVFGVPRRRVASFEQKVTLGKRKDGYIDLLWPGEILLEHKTRGKNLDRAFKQAVGYFPGIKDKDLPKYILVCDFENFRLYNLDTDEQYEFKLKDLVKNINLFGFIAGYQKQSFKEEDPVNIEAAELVGKLHDKLKEIGYTGHNLEVYLVRLVFCLFADDTGIFNKNIFFEFIRLKTKEDGSDLAANLYNIFYVLNIPEDKRLINLDESLAEFPYINGKLFEENIPPASFDSEMREILFESCKLDWGKISPAIFGSLFQSVMNPEERRNLGAHYTSEKNILKVIKPLFLDELSTEFETIKNNKKKLIEFHKKLSSLKFLDPACGCGNFLVITYRELRLLELDILRKLYDPNKPQLNIKDMVTVDIDQFYGIEIEEWPARISEVAMWLMDHQMNMKISEEFGEYYVRLPLKKTANIICDNALRLDWENIIKPDELSYILGNPPFVGKQYQNEKQKEDMGKILFAVDGAGVLDYVTAWYIKTAKYIVNKNIRVAFVSTNSITQGEQVGVLWNVLFSKYKIKIHFAHRTFKWSNEASGKAAVYCVIIGFGNYDKTEKFIFEYDNVNGDPHKLRVKNINPYLVEAGDLVILKRRNPICNVPPISFGNMPNDGGNLLLNDKEKNEILRLEPDVKKYIRPLISAKEYFNKINRWCLWLVNVPPSELRNLPLLKQRIDAVKKHRLNSKRSATRKLAAYPALFGEIRQPNSDYMFIPLTTSENRNYIPFDLISKNKIANNTISLIPVEKIYHFGVLNSNMHMVWVKYICGRLKSDYRYSNEIVYNNFPWPENPTEKHIKKVEENAQKILDVRKEFSSNSLADLYDPITMPPSLVKAHNDLDKAVDLCYRPQPFPNETKRIEFLFELYEKYTQPLMSETKVMRKKNN